jgi:hypothetical protein
MLGTRVAAVLSVIVVLSIPFILAASPVAAREPFARVDLRVNGLSAGSGTASVDEAAIFGTIYYAYPDNGDNGQDCNQVAAGLDSSAQGPLSTGESVLPQGEEITACSSLTLSAREMYNASLYTSDSNSEVATVTGTPATQDADTDDSDDSDSGSHSDPSSSCAISDATCSGTFPGIQTPSTQESDTLSFSSRGSSSDRTNRR